MPDEREYSQTLPVLIAPRFSIDKITLLVYSPGFSEYEASTEFDDYRGHYQRKKLDEFKKYFEQFIEADLSDEEKKTSGAIHYSMETKLYAYHYRIRDVDVQFCTKLPRSKRLQDTEYIEVFGDDRDESRGYMYEYYSNDYNVRIEYNPNKVDISVVTSILSMVAKLFYKETCYHDFIKVSRIDFAFDYPEPVNPALINFAKSRKHNTHGGTQGIETIYYGAKKSAFNLVVYDKKKEYLEKYNILYSGAWLWRIELRCHHVWLIHQFPEIGRSVLPRIEIFNAGLKTGDYHLDMALMIGVHWGIKTGLAMMPEITKKRCLKMYRSLRLPTITHPGDLYLENFLSVWEPLKEKILKAFGLDPELYCSRALSLSKL